MYNIARSDLLCQLFVVVVVVSFIHKKNQVLLRHIYNFFLEKAINRLFQTILDCFSQTSLRSFFPVFHMAILPSNLAQFLPCSLHRAILPQTCLCLFIFVYFSLLFISQSFSILRFALLRYRNFSAISQFCERHV